MAASWWLIVLSWNGREDTLACLRSLRGLRGADTRVVVVDNGSTDGSVEAVREQHPEVDVVENGRNLGFSGGNNAGIRHALEHGAAWVVLVNNDAILAPDAVERLRAAATARPRAGMLAGKLFFDEPPDRIWFAGQRFSAALGYSGRPHGYGRSDAPRYRRPGPTDRAAGAFMAVSRSVVERIGDLDDALFAYVEDVDWSLRARQAGFDVWFVPDAVAWHRVSGSTGGERASTHALYYGVRNTIAVCERHLPLGQPLKQLRRWFILAVFLFQALALSEGRRPFVEAVRAGYRDVTAGRFGERPARPSSSP
jgi:GT2 family glycosyltransferase